MTWFQFLAGDLKHSSELQRFVFYSQTGGSCSAMKLLTAAISYTMEQGRLINTLSNSIVMKETLVIVPNEFC